MELDLPWPTLRLFSIRVNGGLFQTDFALWEDIDGRISKLELVPEYRGAGMSQERIMRRILRKRILNHRYRPPFQSDDFDTHVGILDDRLTVKNEGEQKQSYKSRSHGFARQIVHLN